MMIKISRPSPSVVGGLKRVVARARSFNCTTGVGINTSSRRRWNSSGSSSSLLQGRAAYNPLLALWQKQTVNASSLAGPLLTIKNNKTNLPQRQLQRQQRRTAMTRIWDKEAVVDLFDQYAKERDGVRSLNWCDIRDLLRGIGERPVDATIAKLFEVADQDCNGVIDLEEFLVHADTFLGDNPARIILVVGGPGSGKGMLSARLIKECNVVHLSSGDLLREEIAADTKLGRTVKGIMSRGELVSSAIMVALMKKRMKNHPGKRVLLDGFPRSIENAHDLVTLCGKPELALHLVCDDTILMERIMERGSSALVRREDDNFQTALQRLRTYHKYHHVTLEWLRENHVPIVNLDCSGDPESVWQQLVAIGRLMRPAVKLPIPDRLKHEEDKDWSNDPERTDERTTFF